MYFRNLCNFIEFLREKKELIIEDKEVSPEYEAPQIAEELVKNNGPAILFINPKGYKIPLLMNLFGSENRIELALGSHPKILGEKIANLIVELNSNKIKPIKLVKKHFSTIKRLNAIKYKITKKHSFSFIEPNLNEYPITKSWKKDAGRFFTFPLVITRDIETGVQNVGIYRMQVYNERETGMHWQIQKGGGFHYYKAKKKGEDLPTSVVVGADPYIMLSSIIPLPENIDEMKFAGYLRGAKTKVIQSPITGNLIPTSAEIVFEGIVDKDELREEGPFGDHYGFYSEKALFPVFKIKKVLSKRKAIFVASVVGKPPMEDKFLGDMVQYFTLPILKLMKPELVDMWAYYEAGFHSLLVASLSERYKREGMKLAFSLLGEGQLSLTKTLIIVGENVNVKNIKEIFWNISNYVNPTRDVYIIREVPIDTLDFTSKKLNIGSKMIIYAIPYNNYKNTKKIQKKDEIYQNARYINGILFVKKGAKETKETKELMLISKMMFLLDDDVLLSNDIDVLWHSFIKFNPSTDVKIMEDIVIIDATSKPYFPEEVGR